MPGSFPLSLQTSGVDNGPVLLLLSGQANSHAWWDGLRARFEDRYRVVTFDYRGTGGSHGPVADWSTALFADDAARVLRTVTTSPAMVYGTSMGGRVAQFLAARYPGLVDRLILACTSPGGEHAHERIPAVRRRLAKERPVPGERDDSQRARFEDRYSHRPWWTLCLPGACRRLPRRRLVS
jgi:pimeloyl-ACP methyl ester carboxylesterase